MNKQFATVVTRTTGQKAGSRSLTFTASTKSIDRSGDRVLGPWMLDAFRKNGVILWAHDYSSLPIAKSSSIAVVNGSLVCTAEFAGADLNPMADQVFRLYEAGFLRAVSVGFQPIDSPTRNDSGGFDFKTVELLEVSCVPVPANAEALMRAAKPPGAKSEAGRELSDHEVRGCIERALDAAGVPKFDDLTNAQVAKLVISLVFGSGTV